LKEDSLRKTAREYWQLSKRVWGGNTETCPAS